MYLAQGRLDIGRCVLEAQGERYYMRQEKKGKEDQKHGLARCMRPPHQEQRGPLHRAGARSVATLEGRKFCKVSTEYGGSPPGNLLEKMMRQEGG